MMPNMDPQKMKEVQAVSGQINAEIRIVHPEHELRLKFIPTSPESMNFVKKFIPSFAETIAMQLSSFFSINGEIIDVDKPKV